MKYVIIFLLLISTAKATPLEYSKYYQIDLTSPLPRVEDLRKKYITDDPEYDRKYDQHFLIGNIFDKIFNQTIKIYGTSEKRLKTVNEDSLIEMLNSVPRQSWEYIGPYLHTVPGMSEKILNMPGIKETKNKFPSRIAPQLKDMHNIEFLSPHMYYLLMPEAWPENHEVMDIVLPEQKVYNPKVMHNPKYMAELAKLAPRDAYVYGNKKEGKTKDDLRTLNIQPDSPLTSGDIKAFSKSLSSVNAYVNQGHKENLLQIAEAGALLDYYESEQGTALPINSLKGVVNPCQREVQKIIVAGKYQEFFDVVVKDGFSPETWAVTCDKTLKAYRVATMGLNTMIALKNYKHGVYNEFIQKNINLKGQAAQFATLQSIIEMNKAPVEDVLMVRKHIPELRAGFLKSGSRIMTSPIVY